MLIRAVLAVRQVDFSKHAGGIAYFQKEIIKMIIHPDNEVQFVFADGSEEIRKWEINRRWSNEMKERNYYNQRRRYL